jgi:hypothetical protein
LPENIWSCKSTIFGVLWFFLMSSVLCKFTSRL